MCLDLAQRSSMQRNAFSDMLPAALQSLHHVRQLQHKSSAYLLGAVQLHRTVLTVLMRVVTDDAGQCRQATRNVWDTVAMAAVHALIDVCWCCYRFLQIADAVSLMLKLSPALNSA